MTFHHVSEQNSNAGGRDRDATRSDGLSRVQKVPLI